MANNFYEAWLELLTEVMCYGVNSAPRGKPIKEKLHTHLVVTDLRNNILVHPYRDLNYRFMVAEWLWIEAGQEDVGTVARYNKQVTQFSDDGLIFNGAYGPRLLPQWPWLKELVEQDPDTRQGVVSIWTPSPKNSKDIPCTLSLQVLLRQGRLHGVVTMRSQDLWLGLPYDFFNFSQIVNGLAGALGAESGSLTFNVGSSHVYATNFEQAEAVLREPTLGHHLRSPQLPGRPDAKHILARSSGTFPPRYVQEGTYVDILLCSNKRDAYKLLAIMGSPYVENNKEKHVTRAGPVNCS